MPERVTLYTSDRYWRVQIEAWVHDVRLYRSIGTRVAAYHEERITNIWGSMQADWEQEPVACVRIRNVYGGTGPGVATRECEWQNTTRAELKQWSPGSPISLEADGSTPEKASVISDICKVEGTVTVTIGRETLTGVVSASSALREQAESVAA